MGGERYYLYVVREECISCGTCGKLCPEAFVVDKGVGYAQVIYAGGRFAGCIEEAVEQCPVGCIHAIEVS